MPGLPGVQKEPRDAEAGHQLRRAGVPPPGVPMVSCRRDPPLVIMMSDQYDLFGWDEAAEAELWGFNRPLGPSVPGARVSDESLDVANSHRM